MKLFGYRLVKVSEEKTFYACGVSWQHDIGEALNFEGNMPLYSTKERLMEGEPCYKQCGIVEVKMSISRWVHPQDFTKLLEEDSMSEESEKTVVLGDVVSEEVELVQVLPAKKKPKAKKAKVKKKPAAKK